MTVTSYSIFQQLTSVRLASTENIAGTYVNGSLNNGVGATLTATTIGALLIDGVAVQVGNRVLLKLQTSTIENGIYVVRTPGSAISLWMIERSTDLQCIEQCKSGQYFSTGGGNTLIGTMYVLVEPLPSIIGIEPLVFLDVGDSGSIVGPYLLKSANLSDLSNKETGFTNLGLGSGDFLIIDESDFVSGVYTLTNPCPNLILVNATTPGNAVRLPLVDQPQSFIPSQGPVFFIDEGFEGIDVEDASGALISPLEAPACEQFILTSNAFPDGVWFVRSFVSTVNNLSGDVHLSSDNLDANESFTPSNYTPTAGSGWPADSITGNLAGIDAAIATATSIPPVYGEMYFQSNTTPTPIAASNTPIKVSGTYLSGELQGFTQVSGTLTYTQSPTRRALVIVDLTASYDGTAQNTSFYITKNGSVVAKSKQSTYIGDTTPANRPNPCKCIIPLSLGDQLELWVANNDNANDIIVSDLNYSIQSIDSVDANPINNIVQLIWVNDLNGNDSNSGAIDSPMKTYNAARLRAKSLGASINFSFQLMIIGNQDITGDMYISANISIIGLSNYTSGFRVSGSLLLDSDWGTGQSYSHSYNIYIYVGAQYNLIFPAYQPFAHLKFTNCSLNDLSTFIIQGSSTSSGPETVTFENCSTDILPYSPHFITDNINLYLINTDLSDSVVELLATVNAAVQYNLVINNARFNTKNIKVTTSSTSTIKAYITASNTQGATLSLDGTGNTVYVDSTSYMFSLAFANGATLSNIITPSLTDGVVNSNYSPTLYTPTAGTLFATSTLTGNLKGIDLALPHSVLNGIVFTSGVGFSTLTINRSQECKVGNIVFGTASISFTATASTVQIYLGKSFGGSFTTSQYQCIGSGICSKVSSPAIGDARVQSIYAFFPTQYFLVTIQTSANTNYDTEINFTYEIV